MAKTNATDETFEGEPIIGHRIKVLGASGVKTPTIGHKGDWARVTLEGPLGSTTFEPQSDGWVREIELKTSQQYASVEIIDRPPEPAPEGQTSLDEAEVGEPTGKVVRDADGNMVTGPEDGEE